MNNEELAKVPTLERFEADLDDWIPALRQAISSINYLENTGDIASGAMSARKTLAGVIQEMENARHFIAVKRDAIKQIVLRKVTADVDALFDDPRTAQLERLQEDLRPQDED